MKYRPDYPDRFDSQENAQDWVRPFYDWYNNEHRHTSLGLMTPATVHYGLADELTRQRQLVLQAAYEKHPERFVNGRPTPPKVPTVVWINPPQGKDENEGGGGERPGLFSSRKYCCSVLESIAIIFPYGNLMG